MAKATSLLRHWQKNMPNFRDTRGFDKWKDSGRYGELELGDDRRRRGYIRWMFLLGPSSGVVWRSFKGVTVQILLTKRPRSMKEDVTHHSIEGKIDSHSSESTREATQILSLIITAINSRSCTGTPHDRIDKGHVRRFLHTRGCCRSEVRSLHLCGKEAFSGSRSCCVAYVRWRRWVLRCRRTK